MLCKIFQMLQFLLAFFDMNRLKIKELLKQKQVEKNKSKLIPNSDIVTSNLITTQLSVYSTLHLLVSLFFCNSLN